MIHRTDDKHCREEQRALKRQWNSFFLTSRETTKSRIFHAEKISMRLKGGMSLRNGMWHGWRNDIIMRNVKYGKRRKEIKVKLKSMRASLPRLFWSQFK